ncbi:integration host factor [Streptosporangium sp. NBC_01755]|uniref:integration host factor, actinobacterial type n=1 Tax=unclassified Streptosporangium TaxID=2632669 RepID=UPI002DDB54CD|nr:MULTISPECIES: integration host factor, actinobacterial type [unclassified Streptosporangium]WSA28135.1 integration host factor [Streptosporangium sp. NBC_01810]WSD00390.1 integration host factor [Streptosporangium sp. NBC_01755]
MALPKLTPEQRQAALVKAAETRTARAKLLAEVKNGALSLEQLLGRDDDIARRIKVSQALRALPGVGTVKAAQLMAQADVDEARRLGGLGAQQRRKLIEAVGR